MTLNVERLAEALWRTQDERLHGGADGFGLGSHDADAACIAAEYNRLPELPDPIDEAKRAEWIARLDWHGHSIEVDVT